MQAHKHILCYRVTDAWNKLLVEEGGGDASFHFQSNNKTFLLATQTTPSLDYTTALGRRAFIHRTHKRQH